MALISLDEAKSYLRVDSADEDATIGILLASSKRICADVARLSDEQWAEIDSDTEDEALTTIREIMRIAILYTVGYLFEHREEANHNDMMLTLRSILFAVREGVL